MLTDLLIRLRALFRRDAVENELDDELRFHFEQQVEKFVQSGLPLAEARRRARLTFGGSDQIKEECREARGVHLLETSVQDVRHGLRMLRKSPGFTAVAVLTLALGIGANTAIFSVVNGVLLRPLPFKSSARLVSLRESVEKDRVNPVAYPNYLDWRAASQSLEEMSAYTDAEFILNTKDATDRIFGEQVTPSYFPLLGVTAAQGRTFLPEENEKPLANPVAIISYGLWQRNYGSDPEVVGKTVRLNNFDFTIVGVLPLGFRGLSDESDAWIPFMMHDAAWPETAKFHFVLSRDTHWVKVVARLKPRVSLDAARAEMETIQARLVNAYPKENKDRGVLVFGTAERLASGLRAPLLLLLGAVGFVLLIACANVANLLLTRATSREREFAVRLALGAGRARLIRQLIIESLVLTIAGAAAGLLSASWGLKFLVSVLPVTFPTFLHVGVDRTVLLFTAALAIATGVLLGLLPGWNTVRGNLSEPLKEGAKGTGGSRQRRLSSILVVSEIAMTLILMIGAGLLLKSLSRMLTADLGFRADHLLTMRFYVPSRNFQGDAKNRFGPDLAQHLESVPGVESAAVTFIDPFVWGGFQRGFTIDGRKLVTNAEADTVYYQECGPNYFRTMGIRLVAGRDFTVHDSLTAPRVVIVSESFARRFWPGQDPLGKRLKYGPSDSRYDWMQIVGVVRDIKYRSIRQEADDQAVLYGSLLQSEVIINMSVLVRTKSDPAQMIPTLRHVIQEYASDVPVYNIATIGERMRDDAGETRSYALLLSLFAALALLLAAVGIYGVLSYWVAKRTHEIGIRMALGARVPDVLRLVVGEGMRLVLGGVLLGLLGALAITRALRTLLFDVRAMDPVVFASLALALAGIALVACWLPARRAMRMDPMVALRYE
jgi:predicted permease